MQYFALYGYLKLCVFPALCIGVTDLSCMLTVDEKFLIYPVFFLFSA